jgi:hypothetical protein
MPITTASAPQFGSTSVTFWFYVGGKPYPFDNHLVHNVLVQVQEESHLIRFGWFMWD